LRQGDDGVFFKMRVFVQDPEIVEVEGPEEGNALQNQQEWHSAASIDDVPAAYDVPVALDHVHGRSLMSI